MGVRYFRSMISPEKNNPTHPDPTIDLSRSLKSLPKKTLLDRTRELAAEERRIGVELLWHLREVDRRRLAEELGFSGIFDYCVKVLKFSEGSAYRRVQAMRALKTTPEIASALKDGRLNVTTASQIQTFLQRSKRAGVPEETIRARLEAFDRNFPGKLNAEEPASRTPYANALFETLGGLSSRELERRLSELAPEIPRVERERAISDSETEIRVTLSNATRSKWNRIHDLAAHRLRFDRSARKIIELTTDVTLETLEKEKGLSRKTASETKATPPPQLQKPVSKTRQIPAAIRRAVWQRDAGHCTYRTPLTGVRCTNRYGIEIDHIHPWSKGGSSHDPENLRLLCSAHHRMVTQQTFGN
jgi:hypothetical protein